MMPKRPHIATMDEVIITREDEASIIEYKEKDISTTHLTLGPKIHTMDDQDILDSHNACIQAQLELMKNYKHVATEIPPGNPQVKYFAPGDHWTPRGDVLRCVVTSNENHETSIIVDDKEFTMQEFGKLLSPFEGCGMRIIMVPEDETCQSPSIEIKDPTNQEAGSIALAAEFISMADH